MDSLVVFLAIIGVFALLVFSRHYSKTGGVQIVDDDIADITDQDSTHGDNS